MKYLNLLVSANALTDVFDNDGRFIGEVQVTVNANDIESAERLLRSVKHQLGGSNGFQRKDPEEPKTDNA